MYTLLTRHHLSFQFHSMEKKRKKKAYQAFLSPLNNSDIHGLTTIAMKELTSQERKSCLNSTPTAATIMSQVRR